MYRTKLHLTITHDKPITTEEIAKSLKRHYPNTVVEYTDHTWSAVEKLPDSLTPTEQPTKKE